MDGGKALPRSGRDQRVAFYSKGWHMLLRDLQAPTVWDDVVVWLKDHQAPLPSEADKYAEGALKREVN